MRKTSVKEAVVVADFFNMLAAAWFTAGIITPFFVTMSMLERVRFLILGLLFSVLFLGFAIYSVRKERKRWI